MSRLSEGRDMDDRGKALQAALAQIEKRIKEKLGIGAVLDAPVEPLPAPVDF